MKKIGLILFIIILFGFLPPISLAQFDYLDDMINNDRSIYEAANPTFDAITGETTGEDFTLKNIEMIWSADSYVPYDYPGRALAAIDGFVDITVLLDVSGGNPVNLQYSWFVDNMFDEAQSGYGKINFRFGVRKFAEETHTVLVKIFNDSDSFYMEKTITIPIVAPEILIFPSIQNSNFSEQANNLIVSSNKKSSFIAKPFFFSIKKPNDLNYRWRISGQEAISASGYGANVLNLAAPTRRPNDSSVRDLLLTVDNGVMYPGQATFRSVVMELR